MAGDRCPAGPVWDRLLDGCAALLLSQHRLAERLHTAGLISDDAATAALAREDQLDATITDLRASHIPRAGGGPGRSARVHSGGSKP